MKRPTSLRERLVAAWPHIPSRERLILALLYFEGLTLTEAARALGCPVREVEHTVENRMALLLGLANANVATRRRVVRREPRRKAA